MNNELAYMIEKSALYFKNKTAIIDKYKVYTFDEVHKLSDSLYESFKNLCIEKGERIGVLLPNSTEYVITDFSLIKGGFVRVPLNTRLTIRELEYILNDSETSVLVYDYRYTSKVNELKNRVPSLKYLICVDSDQEENDVIAFESMIYKSTEGISYETTTDEDYFQILYTSGTTGNPKGAVTNVRSRIASLFNVFIDEINILPNDVMVHAASLAHGGGTKVLPHFIKGATNILLPKFTAENFLETVERYKVTTTWMVPTMINNILEYPELKKYDISSLRNIIYAGSPMPVATLKKAITYFGNIFIQVYGLSEAPNPDLVLTKEDHKIGLEERPELLASAGREILNVRVEVVNKDGKPVGVDEIGEVIIKGDNLMTKYWGKEEETYETLRDGWLYTGDLAKKDEYGYIYIVDRSKDMIISGGYNIYPREIEEVLYSHPSVVEATVFGIPDEKWGEAVKACVVIREGEVVKEEDLINYCKENLASFKKPQSIDFYDELPKSSNGKILKRELRNKYWENRVKNVN